MEHYLGVPIKKGLFKSPLRQDNHPTCAFYKSKTGELRFKDFRGDHNMNAFDVVMHRFNCSFYLALQIIANDFGLITRPDMKKNKSKINYSDVEFEETEQAIIRVEIREFQDYELRWWERFGITEKTLKKFKVFSCKNIWLNGNLFYTETPNVLKFGYYGGIKDGVELWRIYTPTQRKFKFVGNWKSNKLQGASLLPKEGGDILCITKSQKDVMLLYELGIPAIAPCSENTFVTDKQYEKLKSNFKHIFVFFDNDRAGISNLVKIKRQYPELICTCIPRNRGSKDISDFYAKHGKKKTLALIKEAKQYYLYGGKEKRNNC